jgi:hypothetical protein
MWQARLPAAGMKRSGSTACNMKVAVTINNFSGLDLFERRQ